jgi:hypothetical protein
MHEALGMAEAAHEAMTRFSGDSEVRRICDLYLGDSDVNRLSAQGKQYWRRAAPTSASQPIERGTNRMQQTATFASLLIFEKDPSVLAANDDQWRAQRTNADVVRVSPAPESPYLHIFLTQPHRSFTPLWSA